jgi:large conductance mechanosensitive channel
MWSEFKKFAVGGSVVDLAVGLIIGAAFGKIVASLVGDILMPPIGLLIGRVNVADLFVSLNGPYYHSLAAAKAAGALTLNYGAFLTTVVEFLIVALAVFMLVRQVNRLRPQPAPAAPATRDCPHCLMAIPIKATRCPHCTSDLGGGKAWYPQSERGPR